VEEAHITRPQVKTGLRSIVNSMEGAFGLSGWLLLGAFAGCGLVGGVGKALFGGAGVVRPKTENGIWLPGVVGTVLAGALAASLSWALYGPFADALAIGSKKGAEAAEYSASFSELAGAVLVGFAGAQWIRSESDKRLTKAAAVEVATKKADQGLADAIADATPREALQLATNAPVN
jgi:hypothetical protein